VLMDKSVRETVIFPAMKELDSGSRILDSGSSPE